MIRVITEKDLIDYIGKYDYIIVPMNCYGNFGNGFSYKVKTYYPYVEMMENHMTNYGDKNKLGTVFEVKFKNKPKFLIAYVTFGYNFRPDLEKDFLDYNALESVMRIINDKYANSKIACPIIGCNRFDGNGDKEKVYKILNEFSDRISLFVYDYYQRRKEDEELEQFKFLCYLKEVHKFWYKKLLKEVKDKNQKLKELRRETERELNHLFNF